MQIVFRLCPQCPDSNVHHPPFAILKYINDDLMDDVLGAQRCFHAALAYSPLRPEGERGSLMVLLIMFLIVSLIMLLIVFMIGPRYPFTRIWACTRSRKI